MFTFYQQLRHTLSMTTETTTPVTLSQAETAMAEAYAVFYPHRPGRSKVMTWVNKAQARLKKQSFKQDEWRRAYERLVEQKVLLPSLAGRGVVASGPSARVGAICAYCLSAIRNKRALFLLEQLELAEFSYRYQYREKPDEVCEKLLDQHVRIAILTGTAEHFDSLNFRDCDLSWVIEPEATRYLRELPDTQRNVVYTSGVDTILSGLKPPGKFLTLALTDAPQPETLLDGICLVMLLRGEFDDALALCDQMEKRVGDTVVVDRTRLLVRATVALFSGDCAQARTHLLACLERERQGTRKKLAIPDGHLIDFAALCLLGQSDQQASALYRSLQNKRFGKRKPQGMNLVYSMAIMAEDQNVSGSPFRVAQSHLHTDVFLAIASCWHGDYTITAREKNYVNLLQDLLAHVHRGGYVWPAAELLSVLEHSRIDANLFDPRIVAVKNEAGAAERHRQLGTQSLTTLITRLEPWEANLRQLERLKPAPGTASTQKRSDTQPGTRLLWRIEHHEQHIGSITPVQQKLGANQQWSKGRKVSLQRLQEQTESFDFLLAQDRAAAATIRKSASWGWGGPPTRYETSEATIYHLIGHPHVEDVQGNPIEVVERQVALLVNESGVDDAAVLTLKLEPDIRAGSYWASLNVTGDRLEVTHFTAAQKRLRDVIPPEGMMVPMQGRERLLDVVANFADVVQIQSDAEAAGADTLKGATAPVLELELMAEGLLVRARVEPLPGSDVLFDCATGGAVVYVQAQNQQASGMLKGRAIAVRRDLAAEQQLLLQLVDATPVLASCYAGTSAITIPTITDALELLEQLQHSDTRCIWPRGEALKITHSVDQSQLRISIKSGEEWFASSGELKVEGEDAIALRELLQLTRLQPKSRFVEVGKGQYLALSERLQQQLQVMSAFAKWGAAELPEHLPGQSGPEEDTESGGKITPDKRSSQKPRADDHIPLHPLALVALAPLVDATHAKAAERSIEGDKHWHQQLALAKQALGQPAALPSALDADLRTYQYEGYLWLMQLSALSSLGGGGIGACLADDMGLGKTVQTLALLLSRAPDGPALVVAPTSVAANWLLEAQRFAPTLKTCLYSEAGKERKTLLEAPAAFDVVVVSYGLLHSDVDAFADVRWHTVVLDEAQAIKNAATQRAKSARRLEAAFRLATTGTPVQNNLMDLHSLFEFLNPGLMGSQQQFFRRYAVPIERDGDARARAELQLLTAPFILRRRKREVLKELPTRTEINLSIELASDEAALYESMRLEALALLSDAELEENPGKKKFIILSHLTRLRRLCCNPLLVESGWAGSQSKLELFNSTLVELLTNGHKVLVFSQYVDHLKIMEEQLKLADISYQYLDGSTPAAKRQQRVAAFQQGEGDVFLISLTAGGTGLNLTAADYVIHLDPWWNPAVEDQASDRAHRIGQRRPVTIYRMVTKGTIEEQILELHGHKRNLAKSILTGTENSRIKPEQLLALLSQPLNM